MENIKKVGAEDLARCAEELVASYLKPGVETEVNVSDNMKRNIMRLVHDQNTSQLDELMKYLDKAQNEILMIMAMGAFPRFMKSSLFIEYKVKVKEADAVNSLRSVEAT